MCDDSPVMKLFASKGASSPPLESGSGMESRAPSSPNLGRPRNNATEAAHQQLQQQNGLPTFIRPLHPRVEEVLDAATFLRT